ncbi:MAG: rhodanese-like domain-containing protein [Bacteroidales bacterium]|nr:rhodanese-like domain-containing protein [Bacteroidales bacterium]
MKKFQFTPRQMLSVVILSLGIIIAAVPKDTTTPYKLSADQILEEMKSGTQYLYPDLIAQMLVEGDPTLQLIDVRPPAEYEKYHLPGAINIPFDELLSSDYQYLLNQDVMMNVLYANGTTRANEAWMLIRQLGYDNNYVLTGGLNYWVETILNPQAPATSSPDDEFARYDFRKAASGALGGGAVAPVEQGSTAPAAIPRPRPQQKKQAVQGGCS